MSLENPSHEALKREYADINVAISEDADDNQWVSIVHFGADFHRTRISFPRFITLNEAIATCSDLPFEQKVPLNEQIVLISTDGADDNSATHGLVEDTRIGIQPLVSQNEDGSIQHDLEIDINTGLMNRPSAFEAISRGHRGVEFLMRSFTAGLFYDEEGQIDHGLDDLESGVNPILDPAYKTHFMRLGCLQKYLTLAKEELV